MKKLIVIIFLCCCGCTKEPVREFKDINCTKQTLELYAELFGKDLTTRTVLDSWGEPIEIHYSYSCRVDYSFDSRKYFLDTVSETLPKDSTDVKFVDDNWISFMKDGKQFLNKVKYKPISRGIVSSVTFRSSGPDRVMHSSDDITRKINCEFYRFITGNKRLVAIHSRKIFQQPK